MTRMRVREVMTALPDADYFRSRSSEGWKLVAVEWEREEVAEEELQELTEVPYGLRVADDCMHLEEDPGERQAITAMLDLLVDDDVPLAQVTEELNRKGYRTRRGSRWTQAAVYDLLPRLIEAAPRVYSSEGWTTRRQRPAQRS